MKNVFRIILLLLLLKAGTAAATTQIPAELHGFWQLPIDDRSEKWSGMNVGNNYVEINFDLFTTDSMRQSGNQYTLFLTRDNSRRLTITVDLLAKDSAKFVFAELHHTSLCKHFDRDPALNYLSVADYSKVISEKLFANANTREPFALKKGKLLYDGKRWNIRWLGEDKRHEYRAIIENEGNHRLITLAELEDHSLKVTYYGKSTIYKKLEAGKTFPIFGNWYEPQRNAWVFGFFETFAIYDGKFWDYKTLTITKNKGTATLQNGKELLQLSFQQIKDSSMKVVINKEKAVAYRLAGRTLPNYKTSDTTSFVDTHYARIDTAFIAGYVRNRTPNNPFEVTILDPITDDEVSYYATVDDAGRFEMKVPLYNSSMAFMDWKTDVRQMNVLEPSEHYVMFCDATTKQTLFMGKNARFQNELATMDFWEIPSEQRVSGQKPLSVLSSQQQLFSKKKDYINRILNQMPAPSTKFRYFLNNYVKYAVAADLMQQRFSLDRNAQERFPDEYIDFVKNTMLTNPVHPMTLNRDFFRFIRDYVGYYTELKGNYSINSLDALLSLIKAETIKLDASDGQVVETYTVLLGLIIKGDTAQAKKMAGNLTQKQIERMNNITNVQYQEAISTEMSRMASNARSKREIETLETEINDKYIRNVYVATVLYRKLNDDRSPMDSTLLDSLLVHVESPAFRKKVLEAQTFYTELSGRSLEHAESLKNTDHLSYAKSADSLWVELIRPYKGKIIYVDFWGTWCGPCKKEMEYVAGLKKQFVGKDVIFMYLANNSPEESWKNVIKSYSLTGENVVHYRLPAEQQAMIEQRFGINSFPTYMIVDRSGNVVDTKPPRPSQMETTVDFLNGWLEKK